MGRIYPPYALPHRQNILINTLATFPNVTEIVVLIDGEADIIADHYSFEGPIKISAFLQTAQFCHERS